MKREIEDGNIISYGYSRKAFAFIKDTNGIVVRRKGGKIFQWTG